MPWNFAFLSCAVNDNKALINKSYQTLKLILNGKVIMLSVVVPKG
jgi:hypothetical protein